MLYRRVEVVPPTRPPPELPLRMLPPDPEELLPEMVVLLDAFVAFISRRVLFDVLL